MNTPNPDNAPESENSTQKLDLNTLAIEACDMWQEHLSNIANNPEIRSEFTKFLEPQRRLFADWAKFMQNGFPAAANPASDNPEPEKPLEPEKPPEPQSKPTTETDFSSNASSEQQSNFQNTAQSSSSHNSDSLRVAQLALRVAELERRLAQLEAKS